MSKRSEQRALEAYPISRLPFFPGSEASYDTNEERRMVYKKGYEQAEKDIIALIESRLSEIIGDAQPKPILRMELEELITKIKQ